MQIDLDALERYARAGYPLIGHPALALIAKVRELEQQRDTARGVPEGYRLVPAEPTEEMLDAGWQHTGDPCWKHNVADAYRAMLAAAPTPPDGDALYTMDQMRDYAQAFHRSRVAAMAASKGEGGA